VAFKLKNIGQNDVTPHGNNTLAKEVVHGYLSLVSLAFHMQMREANQGVGPPATPGSESDAN